MRLPRDLVEQIRELSIKNDRSLSGELREALRLYIYVVDQLHNGKDDDVEHTADVFAVYASFASGKKWTRR